MFIYYGHDIAPTKINISFVYTSSQLRLFSNDTYMSLSLPIYSYIVLLTPNYTITYVISNINPFITFTPSCTSLYIYIYLHLLRNCLYLELNSDMFTYYTTSHHSLLDIFHLTISFITTCKKTFIHIVHYGMTQ